MKLTLAERQLRAVYLKQEQRKQEIWAVVMIVVFVLACFIS